MTGPGVKAPNTVQPIPTIATEPMLVRWAESSNGGASITFLLSDAAELAPFKAMTVAKGGRAGQRFMAALALLGDDEQPVPVPSAWVTGQSAERPAVDGVAAAGEPGGHTADARTGRRPTARVVRWRASLRAGAETRVFSNGSRPAAAAAGRDALIFKPYLAHLEAQQLPDVHRMAAALAGRLDAWLAGM